MSLHQQFASSLALFALVAIVVAKPPPSFGPWGPSYSDKPVYYRSLGPPASPDISTITIPFKPKSSPFFPKFVDPKSMIAMKTDMLSNLFGGLGPVIPARPIGAVPPQVGPSTPLLYAPGDDDKLEAPPKAEIVAPSDESEVSPVKRAVMGKSPKFGPKFGPPGTPFGGFPPQFGPPASPFGPAASPFAPAASPFKPFGSFGPYGAPYAPYAAPPYGGMYPPAFPTSRKRRSIAAGSSSAAPKDIGPPPAYPGLATIAEEPESPTSAVPKQYLPGFFGPFGPYGPMGPVVDPSFFITKKTAFLNTLFTSLAASTPAPATEAPATQGPLALSGFWDLPDAPAVTTTPKPTIVPPGFWAPSSVIPGPTEYTDKVNTFLSKLFTSIATKKMAASNATDSSPAKRAVEPVKNVVTRSLDDLQTISDAKDSIVDSIIAELGSVKADMVSNFDDLVAMQKMEAMKTAITGKKPVKPFKAAFASMWAPPPVDTTLPFQQRMTILSQVFDMLTELEKNITSAVNESMKSAMEEPVAGFYYPVTQSAVPAFNASFFDAIKAKLASLEPPKASYPPAFGYGAKFARQVAGKGPSPFYLPNPKADEVKRNVQNDDSDREQFKRGVKMSMHQGYQSMPPGAIETVQAGGGATPEQQGGGINLFDESDYDWSKFAEYFKDQNSHHHNHH